MRRLGSILSLFIISCVPAMAQNWSGVISPSRAIDWAGAGVVGGIPDATWTQSGSTITGYGTVGTPASAATINTAIAACGTNHYVHLTGTFVLNTRIDFAGNSNCVLRGDGADQTIIRFTAGPGSGGCFGLGGGICIFNGDNFEMHDGLPNTANWTAGYAKGATSITLSSTTNLQVGSLLAVWQADPGSDPGQAIWNCQNHGVLGDCSQQGGLSGPVGNSQVQIVTVTSIPGGGAGGAVGIAPGLYSPIWSAASTPQAGWVSHLPIVDDGIENLTLDASLTTDGPGGTLIFFAWAENCWVTGVRTINQGAPSYQNSIWTYQTAHLTFQNNYIYGSNGTSASYGIEVGWPSFDVLVANNIFQHTASPEMITGGAGNVFIYNFATDNFYTANNTAPAWEQSDSYADHQDGSYFNLFEGNVGAKLAGDDIHGTGWMTTGFRNYWAGRDGPFKTQSTMVADIEAGNRYYNLIGNVLGETGYHTTYKDIPSSNVDNTGCGSTGPLSIYALGWAGSQACNFSTVYNDLNTAPTMYFWGNYDTVTAAIRWCGNSSDPGWSTTCASTSEVPTGLSSFAQTVPANTTLPTSFYYSSKPFWYNDGIGHTTIPFPAIGPDVSGSGPGNHVNVNPAQACFKNIGADLNYASFQGINSITESGTTATITLSGAAPAAFVQYGSFWISGSTVAGYNRLWQIATVSGSTITFTATAGLGNESSGQVFANFVKAFNANTCYSVPVPAHTPHYPHISDMSAWYGAVSLELVGNRAGICNWGSNLFDYLVSYNANGGAFCENINGKVYIVLYIEGSDVTANPNVANHIADFYNLQEFAVANGFVMEQMLIHQSQDYNHNIWTQRDKFDVFDNGSGVFTSVSGVFTDVTTNSYSGGSTAISDTLYVGYMEPFDQMNFVIATARVGGSVTWQYWNGSAWSTLTLHTDGTSGLTATGQAYFYPPSDWAQTSVNNSKTKFWVRAVVSGQSTSPIYTTVKGDTQLTGGLNRGWAVAQSACPGNAPNGTSCFINAGRLLYNANPPAGQTARFLQQGRSANFNNSYTLMNPSDIQLGVRTMAPWLETFLTGTPEGVMFDDAPNWPTDDRLANMIEISTDANWVTNKNAVFTRIAGDWHSMFGVHFLVGGNAQTHVAVCYVLDWCYAESTLYTSYAPQQEEPNSFDYTVNGSTTYDAMLTANNATNIPASEMCYDWPNSGSNSYVGSLGNTGVYNTGTHYWDRGQRGPMTCLAQHYLAGNPNTGFAYHNQGSFIYDLTDEVYVYGPATTITSNITQGMAPGTITIASAAGCTPFDYNTFGYLRVGTTSTGDTFYGTISGTTFTTTTTAANSYSSGNEAHCVQSMHQAQGATPSVASVFLWATWFPAMAVDVGIPNTGGLSSGARVMPWKTGGTPDYISGLAHSDCDNVSETGDFAGRCANLHRRDYTKAIILYRDKKFPTKNVELDTYSQPIALGGIYYPLLADGTTSAGVSTIQLRGSEGAILMLGPIGGGAPGAPSGKLP